LREVVADNADVNKQFSSAELTALFDPRDHVRAAARIVDKVLSAFKEYESTSTTEDATCPTQK
jgi:hypothetical protein